MIKQTFLGVEETPYEKARAVIIPVPYDAMASYGTGARFGPDAILRASQQVETYDEELERELEHMPVFTHEPVWPDKSAPEAMIDVLEKVIAEVAEAGKTPIILGGDHSLSIAPTRYFAKKYPGVGILHLDAHSDLRKVWEESSYSHACSMRHAYDLGAMLVQVGIRSTPKEVVEECKEHRKVFLAPHVPVDEIMAVLPDKVYISLDIDVLDPSLMPSTGTPEPGGIGWYDMLKLLRATAQKKQVLGFDLMELSPVPGLVYPEYTAARLLTKFLGYQFIAK
ncbi:MAG: agmatinase [Candidatus Terrybacteria bacterium RIFCSPLOWO2_01_FULL_44_24]|uniref:Agmatinase n=1 Tax=Candidatus Terrybacteria bacterium RIFCSPHIGHO2_01_FULL_43_35 TaxID=1802361 RepID=A0A1G2PFA9_9BACT|nr:MAG: agmatinase [Candidatus Terrybacteria bacterium RIFCSPHIGHO2_01_FULL_43_35]OHA50409.1 MAG: agmatinase [Candidatus Terrybacteria bacterium RIFCSPHIGHO2_02_FULL_43_14]OHA51698.1 MAG: agmatinase [Candidatus Terrybacteria bacterium RIFCSPLOWO2_01_FULL_44_24]